MRLSAYIPNRKFYNICESNIQYYATEYIFLNNIFFSFLKHSNF